MTRALRVALIGDFDGGIVAHRALERALPAETQALRRAVQWQWLATDAVAGTDLAAFDGLWCVPGSPYRDTEGALAAIRWARERRRPFLGTCGGFQHTLLEYARNVLGWRDAAHAELTPRSARAVVAPLSCPLVEVAETLRPMPGTRLAAACGTEPFEAAYHCRFGLNPDWQGALLAAGLRIGAVDSAGQIRAVELPGHPFYVATLFQPERAALEGRRVPLATAWLQACAGQIGQPSVARGAPGLV